jgi:hypothetical protein
VDRHAERRSGEREHGKDHGVARETDAERDEERQAEDDRRHPKGRRDGPVQVVGGNERPAKHPLRGDDDGEPEEEASPTAHEEEHRAPAAPDERGGLRGGRVAHRRASGWNVWRGVEEPGGSPTGSNTVEPGASDAHRAPV